MYKKEFLNKFSENIAKEFEIDIKDSNKVAKIIAEIILEKMSDTLMNKGEVKIHDFGKMSVNTRNQRSMYDFIKKEMVEIDPRNVVVFKSYRGMRERIQ